MLRAMDLLYTAHVPEGDGPHPTILLLHGWGASAHDLIGLAPILHGGGAVVLCPQGPLAFQLAAPGAPGEPPVPGMLGFGWATPPGQPGADLGTAEYEKSADEVRRFLDAAVERYPIDPRKIVPLGFSQGGVLAYDLALRDPGRFAGLVALSGWLPGPVDDAIPDLEMTGRRRIPVAGEVPNPITPPSGCHFHPRCPFANDRCRREAPKAMAVEGGQVSCHGVEEGRLPEVAVTGEPDLPGA